MQKVWEYNIVQYINNKLESFITVKCDETFEVSEYFCTVYHCFSGSVGYAFPKVRNWWCHRRNG